MCKCEQELCEEECFYSLSLSLSLSSLLQYLQLKRRESFHSLDSHETPAVEIMRPLN